jgi:hypothetical protein
MTAWPAAARGSALGGLPGHRCAEVEVQIVQSLEDVKPGAVPREA